MTPERARELLDKATPGPWERHPDQPRALCNLDTKFLVHHEVVKNRGMEPSAEDVANTDLIAAAPALAQTVANLHYEYAVRVEQGGKTYLLGETIDGPYPFDESSPNGPCWYRDADSARDDAHAWNANPYEKGEASIVRRLVSDLEVVE